MADETEWIDAEGWKYLPALDGSARFRLHSWKNFFGFVESEIFDSTDKSKHSYIWRGQRDSGWSLSSSLDRLFQRLNLLTARPDELEKLSAKHLRSFKLAARGRRGPNPAVLAQNNDWWALGQHFGLATPLLDWTRSPFAAAYFAFEEQGLEERKLNGKSEFRAVYALDEIAIVGRDLELGEETSVETGRLPTVEVIEAMSDENPRLVNQGGCFTRAPISVSIEQWVARAFEGSSERVLLKIEIPDDGRVACLRALNRMNINHLSLFPDLSGTSRSTNLKLELEL